MEKKTNKKSLIAVIVLIALVVIAAVCYFVFRPGTSAGGKTITVDVIHSDESTAEFTYTTDAEYLGEVLVDEGLVEGSTSEYGLYIETVDGEYADYDADGAYWSIYVNGEYGMYGADTQPIADGDVFTLAYEVYVPAE